jgi:hypothetical protein
MVIFRAENVNGIDETHAIITPTTKGIRKALKDEGIEFTFPLTERDVINKNSTAENEPKRDEEASAKAAEDNEACCKEQKNDNDDDDGDGTEWLETIGIEKANFKVTQTNRTVALENAESFDNKPHSTILVQGGDVHALFNFLLNSRICFTNTGCLAGVPPTLISSTCFIGATMQKLKVCK